MIIVNGQKVSDDGDDIFEINTEGGNYNESIKGNYVQGSNRTAPKPEPQPQPTEEIRRGNRVIHTNGGNYNRQIKGCYIEGDVIDL